MRSSGQLTPQPRLLWCRRPPPTRLGANNHVQTSHRKVHMRASYRPKSTDNRSELLGPTCKAHRIAATMP